MKLIFPVIFIGLFGFQSFAQQDCDVLIAALQGKYLGDCKNHKAQGPGTADGKDSYTGNFKNGYPSGHGTYTFDNGNFFEGEFNKGLKEGEGSMHYKETTGDSIVHGFWKKDIYVGAWLQPFEIETKSAGFLRLDVTPDVGAPNSLTIVSRNVIRANSLMSNTPPGLPVINYFSVDIGSYEREERSTRDKKTTLILYGMTFPFHILVNYDGESFKLMISKPGTWGIEAEIQMRRD